MSAIPLFCRQPAADAPAAAEAESGNEIIVTAGKREQTLQDIPIAVSVTTAQTIERANIRDLKDLATVAGVRPNQLVGYGLVVGLDGTGDQTTQAPFTAPASDDYRLTSGTAGVSWRPADQHYGP